MRPPQHDPGPAPALPPPLSHPGSTERGDNGALQRAVGTALQEASVLAAVLGVRLADLNNHRARAQVPGRTGVFSRSREQQGSADTESRSSVILGRAAGSLHRLLGNYALFRMGSCLS